MVKDYIELKKNEKFENKNSSLLFTSILDVIKVIFRLIKKPKFLYFGFKCYQKYLLKPQ